MPQNDHKTRISTIDYISKADDYTRDMNYVGDELQSVVHQSLTSGYKVTETFVYTGTNITHTSLSVEKV